MKWEDQVVWRSQAGRSEAHHRATCVYEAQQLGHQKFTREKHEKAREGNLRLQAANARTLRVQRTRAADREEQIEALEEEHP